MPHLHAKIKELEILAERTVFQLLKNPLISSIVFDDLYNECQADLQQKSLDLRYHVFTS